MSRITKVGLSLCLAGAVAACEGLGPTAPDTVAVEGATRTLAAASQASELHLTGPRPVTGRVDGSDEYGDVCGGGEGMTIVSTGVGTISHFGKAVMVSTTCVNLSDFSVIGPTPFSIQGADGDQIGGYLTDFAYTDYGFDLYTSITWGTGRFEGATGELTFPTHSTGSGVWWSGVEGWITY
jgi:hypothetical protein